MENGNRASDHQHQTMVTLLVVWTGFHYFARTHQDLRDKDLVSNPIPTADVF